MCRWAAYIGSPIFLEDVICRPGHSLVRQSHDAQRCLTPVNADGFGLAWYGERAEPGLYRDVMPAWSDRLSEAEIRAVATYVHGLGGGE